MRRERIRGNADADSAGDDAGDKWREPAHESRDRGERDADLCREAGIEEQISFGQLFEPGLQMPVALSRFAGRGLLEFGLADAQICRLAHQRSAAFGADRFRRGQRRFHDTRLDAVGLIFVPRVGGFRLGQDGLIAFVDRVVRERRRTHGEKAGYRRQHARQHRHLFDPWRIIGFFVPACVDAGQDLGDDRFDFFHRHAMRAQDLVRVKIHGAGRVRQAVKMY
jgi:hypothetical protein